MGHSFQFDTQHDHILKKLNLGLCPTKGSDPRTSLAGLNKYSSVSSHALYHCAHFSSQLLVQKILLEDFTVCALAANKLAGQRSQ